MTVPTTTAGGAASAPATIFAVDDDPMILTLLEHLLRTQGHRPQLFRDAADLLAALEHTVPALIITDLNMPDTDGMALLREVSRRALPVPVVMLTGANDLSTALAAIHAGAADYLTKPFTPERLDEVLTRVLRLARLEQDNKRYLEELRQRDALMQEELKTARAIQQHSFPATVPQFPGFTFGMALYPSLAIGGDLIDFYPGESGRNGRLGIMVADIAGHGVAAALLTMLFKSTAAEIFRTAATPAAGMTELNRRLATDFPESHFACATYLELTAGSRTIRFARGSQEPLLLLPAHGAISEYTDGGTPPGMFAPDEMGDISYTDQELTLAPGDTLLLYTDGVSEALSPGHTMLGPETLQRWISERRALPPAELVRELHTRVTGFTGTTRFEDDFTILALRAE